MKKILIIAGAIVLVVVVVAVFLGWQGSGISWPWKQSSPTRS